jgi:hypothetical protein
MCKRNVKMDISYAKICKYEHENNLAIYSVRSCLRLMFNRLKEMKNPTLFISHWGPSSRKLIRKLLCVHWVKKLFENLPQLKVYYELIETELKINRDLTKSQLGVT